jgi:myosin heavy subunit
MTSEKEIVEIDGPYVEGAFEEIKKDIRYLRDRIDVRAPGSAATVTPDAQAQDAGGDVRADEESAMELEEAMRSIQKLSEQNKDLESKLEAASGSAAQPEGDGEIERLKEQEAALRQQLDDAQHGQQAKETEIAGLKEQEAAARQQLDDAQRLQQAKETEIANLEAQEAAARQQLDGAQRVQQEKDGEIERLKAQNEEKLKQLEAEQRAQEEKDGEIERLRSKNVEDRQVLQETAQQAQQDKEKEIESLKEQEAAQRQQLDDVQRRQQEKDGEIERLKSQEAAQRQQLDDAQRGQQEKATEIERLKGENEELSRQLAAVASSDRIEDVIWPAFMAEQSIADYKERLKGELHADAPSPLAIRLVADLFSYNANHKLKSDKKTPLLSSVHRLGESLFAWLSESDSDPDQVYEKGEAWADLLNSESNNVFRIEVPMIGCAFDRKIMVNYGPSAADVGSIQSWCVKDAEGRTQHPGEVTLT